MSEAWAPLAAGDEGFERGGSARWRAAPSELSHPAHGARWRITGEHPVTAAVELDIELSRFSGAYALRAIHTGPLQVPEHLHDWPSLTLHLTGAYTEIGDWGEVVIDGPAAALHPPNEAHGNRILPEGMEAIVIHFDPAWVRQAGTAVDLDRSRFWTGGRVGAAARALAGRIADSHQPETEIRAGLGDFLVLALSDDSLSFRPPWLESARRALQEPDAPSTWRLARELGLHPAWLARAYRAAVGEGLVDTLRRRRVERAACLLRYRDEPLACVALEAGFCDQSHMNRDFRRLLGRTPAQVRSERKLLTPAPVRPHGPGRP